MTQALPTHLQRDLQELGAVAVGVLADPQPRVGQIHILDRLQSIGTSMPANVREGPT